jgi:hypothetical protein
MRYARMAALMATAAITFIAFGCEEPRGSIEGTVYMQDGTPGSNLVIRAVRPEYPGVLVRTDDGGSYHVENIPVGDWDIEFFDEGGWQVGLETVHVTAGETVALDFAIGEKPLPEGFVPARIEGAP